MKLINYWHVRLYRRVSASILSEPMETLIFEGYSKDKPDLQLHDEGLIELFTKPDQLETKTIRTYGIDSMVCTPVYEEDDKAAADAVEQKVKVHDHACVNCFTDKGPCLGECNVQDENRALAAANAAEKAAAEDAKAAADAQEAKSRYDYESFKSAARPLVKWLNENANPHALVIVESDGATLYTGEIDAPVREFIKD